MKKIIRNIRISSSSTKAPDDLNSGTILVRKGTRIHVVRVQKQGLKFRIFFLYKQRKSSEFLRIQNFSFEHHKSVGGDKRDRTADLLNAIQALSQLSYTPEYSDLSVGKGDM